MRDFAAGLEALMAKKLSDASVAKLANASARPSWLPSMFSKKDTVGSHLLRNDIYEAKRRGFKLMMAVDS